MGMGIKKQTKEAKPRKRSWFDENLGDSEDERPAGKCVGVFPSDGPITKLDTNVDRTLKAQTDEFPASRHQAHLPTAFYL